MKNGKEEIQRQFELLYHKITRLKEEFESSSSYDSSGHNTDSESSSDYELHFEKVNNETATKDSALIHYENSLKNSVHSEEKSNFNSTNDESFNSTELQEETDADSESSSNNQAPRDVVANASIEQHPFSTTSIYVRLGDSEVKENDQENKIHVHDHDYKDICHEHESSKTENADTDTVEAESEENITTDQKDVNRMENPGSAVQNMFESTPHQTNSPGIATYESDTSKIDAHTKELIAPKCSTKHYLHKTRLFMFNIQPRRRLHQLTAIRNEETEELCYGESTKNENPTEPVTEDSVHDKPDIASVLAIATENLTSKTSGTTDISHTAESTVASAFNFISVEDGLISFRVQSDNYCPDVSNINDDTSSIFSETDLDFLDVQDGYITFKAISKAYNANTLLSFTDDEDIFSDEETYSIEALFNGENLIEDTVENDDEYLEGLPQMFDNKSTDKNNEGHNQDDLKITYQAETNAAAVCDAMSSGSELEAPVKKESDISAANFNQTELRSRSTEYSFAGVMLLNALPSVLTSSILSVFSNPAFGFTFYKPVPLKRCSGLTSSDFAKVSFSSQELPFKNLTGLPFGDSDSQFETLSTCSTSSKGSSRTESVCES